MCEEDGAMCISREVEAEITEALQAAAAATGRASRLKEDGFYIQTDETTGAFLKKFIQNFAVLLTESKRREQTMDEVNKLFSKALDAIMEVSRLMPTETLGKEQLMEILLITTEGLRNIQQDLKGQTEEPTEEPTDRSQKEVGPNAPN